MMISEVDLRRRWSDWQPCHGLWSLLPGAVTGEILARTGADFVVVDLQHGAVHETDVPGLAAALPAAGPGAGVVVVELRRGAVHETDGPGIAAAITAAGSVPLVRARSPSFADVGR